MKKPQVNQDLCIGDRLCTTIAPNVFEINEEGKSYVKNPEGDDEETIQQAINQCPSQAISWVEKKNNT